MKAFGFAAVIVGVWLLMHEDPIFTGDPISTVDSEVVAIGIILMFLGFGLIIANEGKS